LRFKAIGAKGSFESRRREEVCGCGYFSVIPAEAGIHFHRRGAEGAESFKHNGHDDHNAGAHPFVIRAKQDFFCLTLLSRTSIVRLLCTSSDFIIADLKITGPTGGLVRACSQNFQEKLSN
jgi:hypothetical protein